VIPISNINKKSILCLFFFAAIFFAGLLDIKYKGLFYRMLPRYIQEYIDKQFK